jgi:tetratricopeptide (TPR) repeat protein
MINSLVEDVLPLLLLIFLSSFLNILLHELGHAIPLFYFTKGQISIYIGSYGDGKASLKIHIRRLLIYIKYNPLLWLRGQCKPPQEKVSLNKRIIFVAFGPLLSVLITLTCWYILRQSNYSGVIEFFTGATFAFGMIYSLSSLLPFEATKKTKEGNPLSNDLNHIIKLVKMRGYYSEFLDFDEYIKEKKYQAACDIMDSLITKGCKEDDIYRKALASNILLKNYPKAQFFVDTLLNKTSPTSEDYINAGYLKTISGDHDEALKLYQEALSLNPNQVYALNNIGYTLTCVQNKHNEALEYLKKAIEINSNFAPAYSNRGYAKLKNGDLDNALADISHSIELENTSAYSYRNLGIYYFDTGNFTDAKIQFEKAKEIDADIPMVNDYLEKLSL